MSWMRSCLATAAVSIATTMALFAAAAAPGQPAQPQTGPQQPLLLHARSRVAGASGSYTIQEKELKWEPKQTVLIICDMWNQHWCQGATRRVGELAPVMNRTVTAARDKGVLIIHAPSSCLDTYKDYPGRALAKNAPKAANLPDDITGWCSKIPSEEKGIYPIDQSDGGCDDGPMCPQGSPWKSQVAAIEIKDEDAISDSGIEIWNLLESRGISNVMLMGVHTNMCVLGRPFGLRQMAQHGKNVVLVRDHTDTMYNSRSWPYVSHFAGTDKIIEHVEKFVAPSILSTDISGQPAFKFKPDNRPRAVFLIGDDEYKTEITLPAFAKKELEPAGIRCTFVIANPKTPNDFKGIEAVDDADLLVVSARRRAPTTAQMAAIRKYAESGKPIVGIRTASHAFDARGKAPAGHAEWASFDPEFLGGHYTGHHANELMPTIERAPGERAHPILDGVKTPFTGKYSLYKTRPLAASAVSLLVGKIPGHPAEPVAWVNTIGSQRVFYTSLGHPGDFETPEFRRLLKNGISWAMQRPLAEGTPEDKSAKNAQSKPAASGSAKPAAVASTAVATSLSVSPQAATETFRTPDDLRLELVLAEPVVRQPVSLSFDERGRMWVVQYLQYPFPAGLKMVSHDGVWRAVYDKVPPPPPHHFRGRDKITIHEDSDGDGIYDCEKTFVDGLNIATAVAHGRGGVWVLNPPYLLFYPDRNHDDIPDGDPEVRLKGFGLEDTHSVINSLRWGPDGWLYAAQGSTVTGHVTAGDATSQTPAIHSMGQLIWRYHPETRKYEVFAEGGGNAFGVEIDAKGRVYSGHNGGDTRGFHYVQGGYYQKGFGKHGPLSNPYAFGYFPAMKHPHVQRFTHTFVFDEASALPERYRGLLFGVDPLANHVVMSEVSRDRSSFQTKDVGLAIDSSDARFRPVDIKLGPDGALYVADWYDRQVNHYRNHEGQIEPENGRIYRLSARGEVGRRKPVDLARLSSHELVELLKSPNKWTRQTALRLVGDCKDRSIVPELKSQLREENGQEPLESLWALHLIGALDEKTALDSLDHPDPYVRLWTARLVCDTPPVSSVIASALAHRAKVETEVEVRSQLACSARSLATVESLPILRLLLAHSEDRGDIHIPLLLWWGIEAKAATDPEMVLQLFEDRSFWNLPIVQTTIAERVMRRFAASGGRQDLFRCAKLLAIAPDPDSVRKLMAGFEAAYAGRSLTGLPPALITALETAGGQSLSLELRRGKSSAIAEALHVLISDQSDRSQQLSLVQIVGEAPQPPFKPVLLRLALHSSDNALRSAALASLAAYDGPAVATEVIAGLGGMSDDVSASAFNLLVSRRTWTGQLLVALEKKTVDPNSVPREVVERIQLIGDAQLASRADRIFGPMQTSTPAEVSSEIARMTSIIGQFAGIPKLGKAIFERTCAGCHTLFSKGGKVGPDLTTYRRDDLDSMLRNIVHPSAEIREGFVTTVVATGDGRVLSGVVAEQDNNIIVLRGADGNLVTLPRSDVESQRTSPQSLMPQGLLKGLTDQDLRDLFAYLRTTQPLID
jgi:putative heme-binding domain-containing protein